MENRKVEIKITDKKPKPSKVELADLPEAILATRKPKDPENNKNKYGRTRAGGIQGGLNLNGKPKILSNGKKVK